MSKNRIQVIAAGQDREALRPLLAELEQKGVAAVYSGETPNRKAVIMVALSANLYADEAACMQILDLAASGAKYILPLRLDSAPVEPSLKNALYARNMIAVDDRTPAQLADRILSALPKPKWVLPTAIAAAALVLSATAGFFLFGGNSEKTPAAMETPAAPVIPAGLTAEELEKVRCVTILGSEFYWSESVNDKEFGLEYYAYNNFDEEGLNWYSCEDGHEIQTAYWEDLRFLSLLPNLSRLEIACADVGYMPDLSQLPKFRSVTLSVCTVPGLDWLSGTPLSQFYADSTNISDYTALNSCEKLWDITIFTGPTVTDLSSLSPASLQRLTIYAFDGGIRDLSGISVCRELKEVTITGTNISNLDFLADKSALEKIELHDIYTLNDISGMRNLPRLSTLEIGDCSSMRDISSLGNCEQLKQLDIYGCERIRDFSCLRNLSALTQLSIHCGRLNDLNFLEGLADNSNYFSLSIDSAKDASALSFIKNYSRLQYNCDFGSVNEVLSILQDVTINELYLYNVYGIDLAALPAVKVSLALDNGNLEDLSKLPELSITKLELGNMQNLQSLTGLEKLPNFKAHRLFKLQVNNCPRLTDWSVLEGSDIGAFSLANAFALPDFSSFRTQSLELENIADVTDLTFLAGLDRSVQYNPLSLRGFEDVRDLGPLEGISIHSLLIPPQLAEQAEDLVRAGTVNLYEVVYPEGGWDNNYEMILLSLDELDTLPPALLRRITTLRIAGDQLFDWDFYDLDEQWEWDSKKNENVMQPMLRNRETGEEYLVEQGHFADFSCLSQLTGLRELFLVNQPLVSLEGIQAMENLERLSLICCTSLTDVSPVFALPNLQELSFRGSSVTSIQGMQNLRQLTVLDLFQCPVDDLSPLGMCGFSAAENCGGFNLQLDEKITAEDLSALGMIPSFSNLVVNSIPFSLWSDYMVKTPVREICACGSFTNNEEFAAFVRQHPELVEIRIPWNRTITDLTPVLELEKLELLQISEDMEEALASLEGYSYNFRIE